MKKVFKPILALLMALGLCLAVMGPAFASGSEADNWLLINDPGSLCLYAAATVNSTAVSVPTGSVQTWASATVVYKTNNPCIYQPASNQHLSADTLEVQGTLVCTWLDHFNDRVTVNAWQSAVTSNPAGTGIITVLNGSTTNPCQPTDFQPGTIQERTVVHTWFRVPGIGLVDYGLETTHWVTR